MNTSQFWSIISAACRGDPSIAVKWDKLLQSELEKLAPEGIIEWNHIFDRLAAEAYRADLWGAAYLINGGASDDGFYYFRCWLIGMGQCVYEKAVANPDNLADVVLPGIEAEAEIYAAAHLAWIAVTGRSYQDPYPARNEDAAMIGEFWDFDDATENLSRLPRLAAMFSE